VKRVYKHCFRITGSGRSFITCIENVKRVSSGFMLPVSQRSPALLICTGSYLGGLKEYCKCPRELQGRSKAEQRERENKRERQRARS